MVFLFFCTFVSRQKDPFEKVFFLSFDLTISFDLISLMVSGITFQTCGPTTPKARLPTVFWFTQGTTKFTAVLFDDLKCIFGTNGVCIDCKLLGDVP